MTGRKYFSDKTKIPFILSACFAIAFFSFMMIFNVSVSYHFINNFPKLISTLAHSFQMDPHLYTSIFYLLHVYFALLLYVGLPIISVMSLALSIFYLKQKKANRILWALFIPLTFVITTYALAEGWLALT